MKESIHIQRAVEGQLSDRRNRAARVARERYDEVSEKIPEYRNLDENIKRKGIELGRIAIDGGKDSVKYCQLKNEIDSLSKQRVSLLEQGGFSEKYLSDVYHCCKCNDTGKVRDGEKMVLCSCYMKLYTEHLQKEANLIHDFGFEGFSLDYYNDTDKDNALLALQTAKKFTDCFGTEHVENLFFMGGTGVGKTHLCGCIAYELTSKGIPVLYLSAAELFDTLTYFGEDEAKRSKKEVLEKILYSVEVLIIDDLGAEKQSATRYSILMELLNNRIDIKNIRRKTIISSNLTLPEIKNAYGERVFSRIATFDICKLSGSDIRILKKLQSK